MKKVLRCLLRILEIIVVIYAVGITTLMLMKNKFGYTQIGNTILVMVNNDNKDGLKHFKNNDLLTLNSVKMSEVNIGDELYYFVVDNNEYVIQTGIVKTKTGDDKTAVYTFENDDNQAIASERVIGSLGKSYSKLGGILSFLESRIGFLLAVILPIMVIFIYQIYNLIVTLKFDKESK